MNGGLNIAALSRRTGVAADTLRKWEQRYGVLRPVRTAGGQRRYSELDVDRVEWLRARLSEGYRIGEAAALLGTGEWRAVRQPAELADALFGAALENDTAALAQLLDQAFTLDLNVTFSDVVEPLLRRVGSAWEHGELTVAQEHLATEAVRARMTRRLAEARGGIRGHAVLACLPGERHDLGLLMLAVMLQADGWQIAYLGPDTPLDDAVAMAKRMSARLLCLSTTVGEHVPPPLAAGALNGTRVVVGGHAADPQLARRLGGTCTGGSVADVVAELRATAA